MQTLMTRHTRWGMASSSRVDMSKSRKRRVCGSLNIVALISAWSSSLAHGIHLHHHPSQPQIPQKLTVIRASFVVYDMTRTRERVLTSFNHELRVYSNDMKLQRKLNHTKNTEWKSESSYQNAEGVSTSSQIKFSWFEQWKITFNVLERETFPPKIYVD